MIFDVLVEVRLKPGVADPQGATVERALPALGYQGVSEVRVGKAIRMTVEAAGQAEAESTVAGMCERLLANPVIEETVITISEAATVG